MTRSRAIAIFFVALSILLAFAVVLRELYPDMVLLHPKGVVAKEERDLIVTAVLLMLIVIVPVFLLFFGFAWWYRAGNSKATYVPEWAHAKMDELIWWAVPFEIILVLGALTWTSTHKLDPYKALDLPNPPITIEVVALDWKWLFIYPDERLATVNLVVFPVDTPINFRITADAPMNSFWIPALGGQIYAMSGMTTELHLAATEAGNFAGSSANFSGSGFSQMRFVARALPRDAYDRWITETKLSPAMLDWATYAELAKPSENVSPLVFGSTAHNLFATIISKFSRAGDAVHISEDAMKVHTALPEETGGGPGNAE